MTILSIQNIFNQKLAAIYDADEIKAIFRYYIEIKLNIVDSFLFNDESMDFDLPNFENDLKELAKGKPVQQIVGRAFFYDYFFRVNQHTLIPRPETEELIYLITEQYQPQQDLNIIDLGTGSGCIPITLNKIFPKAKVTAIDISKDALQIAKLNNEELNTNVNYIQQDLLKNFNLNQKFDIITSNPPYIRDLEKTEMHQNVLDFEPHLALFVSNEDPLIFYDRVAKFGLNHLNENGKIYCEINQYLGEETKELFLTYYKYVTLHQDISGNNRMIVASNRR